jgi:hypothetical protein
MKRLVFESWLLLLGFELAMRFRDFKSLHEIVRTQEVNIARATDHISDEQLCRAVDIACVIYFKQVLCLQRSAATTILLRRYGRKAEMVIGARVIPFQSHAWVEIGDRVVSDKPYMLEIYRVLERC